MRIKVDPDLCEGHNRCFALAPELFEVDDYGLSRALNDGVVPPGREEQAPARRRQLPGIRDLRRRGGLTGGSFMADAPGHPPGPRLGHRLRHFRSGLCAGPGPRLGRSAQPLSDRAHAAVGRFLDADPLRRPAENGQDGAGAFVALAGRSCRRLRNCAKYWWPRPRCTAARSRRSTPTRPNTSPTGDSSCPSSPRMRWRSESPTRASSATGLSTDSSPRAGRTPPPTTRSRSPPGSSRMFWASTPRAPTNSSPGCAG